MHAQLVLRYVALSALLSLAPAAAAGRKPMEEPPSTKAPAGGSAPLFTNLGAWHRAVTTTSPQAQRYFDQGLRFMFAFNLEEAQRSFEEATRLDPDCPLCWWGVGMSLGPHINMPAVPERTIAANAAAQRARATETRATPAERALIDALARRYADPPPTDAAGQAALDRAYADGMRAAWAANPNDADIGAFYAEAMMNLRPWDLWTKDGKPQPGTDEIVTALERVLARAPDHPGANHYYVHALEASPFVERARKAGERVARLEPGAAHLVHMPAHVYERLGLYEAAAQANRNAIAVDRTYLARSSPPMIYPMYTAHDFQFLGISAMMEGRSAEAVQAARDMVAHAPLDTLRMVPGMDYVLAQPIWTLVRFARWDDVLKEPAPPAEFRVATADWHAARALAFAETSRIAEAATEAAAVHDIARALPADAVVGFDPAASYLAVPGELLAGEIAARQGKTDEAVTHLQAAVSAEDALRYNEPPTWFFPVRHVLGWELIVAGRPSEAAAVFRADLDRNPKNGWALFGLANALRRQGRAREAAEAKARFDRAWSHADYALRAPED